MQDTIISKISIGTERQRYQSGKVVPYLKNGMAFKYIYYYNEPAKILDYYLKHNKLDTNDFLFDISRTEIRRRLTKAMKKTGVAYNTLHGFGRKSINTELYKRGADSKTRPTLLGQENENINEVHYVANSEAREKAKEYLKQIE